MSTSSQNLVEQFQKRPAIQQKAIGTFLSFLLSLGIFITIRVIGVIYFAETIVDIIDFNPVSAVNFIVWLGIIAVILIAFAMLNFTIAADKAKLNLDVISATVITVFLYWMIAYNYIGFNYGYLLYNLDIFQRVFVYFTYWISVLAVYGTPDLFLFWLGFSAVFHGIFFFFSAVDLEGKLFVAFQRNDQRVKKAPSFEKIDFSLKDLFVVELVSILVTVMVLYIPIALLNETLASQLFSVEGFILLVVVCFVNSLFYVFSKRMTSKSQGMLFYLVIASTFTAINFFFILLRSWVAAIILIAGATVVILVILNAVKKP